MSDRGRVPDILRLDRSGRGGGLSFCLLVRCVSEATSTRGAVVTTTAIRGTVDSCPVFWKVLLSSISSLSDLRLQEGPRWRRRRKEPQSVRQCEEDVIPGAAENSGSKRDLSLIPGPTLTGSPEGFCSSSRCPGANQPHVGQALLCFRWCGRRVHWVITVHP